MGSIRSGNSNNHDEKFMYLAIQAAKRGIKNGQTPFGACVVAGNRVIATAHNQVWKKQDSTAHAEIECIRRACRVLKSIHLNQCRIYSTCEPCPMCFSACHWARIPHIIYGSSIENAAENGFRELKCGNRQMIQWFHLKMKITPGILKSECNELFKQWKKMNISKSY